MKKRIKVLLFWQLARILAAYRVCDLIRSEALLVKGALSWIFSMFEQLKYIYVSQETYK